MKESAQQELRFSERGAGLTPRVAGQQRVRQCPQQELPHLWFHPRNEPLQRYGPGFERVGVAVRRLIILTEDSVTSDLAFVVLTRGGGETENSWTRNYPTQGLPVSTTSVCLRLSVFLQSRPTIHCVRPSTLYAENEPVSRIKMADYRALVSMGAL